MMKWIVLILAGLFETGWAIGLKYTEGFTRLRPTLWTVLAMGISLWLLGVAMKTLPVGTAYSVWVGVGAVGTVILGIILFGEPANTGRLISVALIKDRKSRLDNQSGNSIGKCDCGVVREFDNWSLTSGKTKSCGCLKTLNFQNASILKGKDHPNWKGGISGQRHRMMATKVYKTWRISIYERDNYTCQKKATIIKKIVQFLYWIK